MMTLKIAFRNILRNTRRSAMTGSAVAVGALALLTFGAFFSFVALGFQTQVVQRAGHLTVYRDGYFALGAGNPAAYGIDDYRNVMALIAGDPVLKPLVNVATPSLTLFGIAGNFSGESSASKTFVGTGIVPSDRDRMRQWNEYGVGRTYPPDANLSDTDETRGMTGIGLARILGLCQPLAIADCPQPAVRPEQKIANAAAPVQDFTDLVRADVAASAGGDERQMPRLNLLAATAGGAPNVVTLRVSGAEPQAVKEFDDNFVGMHLALAQQLLYGRGEHKVTGIVLQLHRSEDLPAARARLMTVFHEHQLPLEVRDFGEITPQYNQTLAFFRSIFLFIAVIMGVIVLFTVVNTMTMSVMERTNEIGTTRALGVRRRGIRRQFLAEGSILGALGATAGVILAAIVGWAVNAGQLSWTPPGNANPIPLQLDLWSRPALAIGTWVALVLIATLAALIPANRAAKLPVVEALRHV